MPHQVYQARAGRSRLLRPLRPVASGPGRTACAGSPESVGRMRQYAVSSSRSPGESRLKPVAKRLLSWLACLCRAVAFSTPEFGVISGYQSLTAPFIVALTLPSPAVASQGETAQSPRSLDSPFMSTGCFGVFTAWLRSCLNKRKQHLGKSHFRKPADADHRCSTVDAVVQPAPRCWPYRCDGSRRFGISADRTSIGGGRPRTQRRTRARCGVMDTERSSGTRVAHAKCGTPSWSRVSPRR